MRRETFASRSIGWIALSVMILASSTHNSFSKALTEALSPLSIVFLSEFLTAFFIFLSFGTLPTIRTLLHVHQKEIAPLLLFGILNGIIAPFFLFTGLQYTTAVNGELFGRWEVIAFIFFGYFLLGERHFTRTHLLAGIIIALGILTVTLEGFQKSFSFHIGDLLIVLAMSVYACGATVFKRFLSRVQPQVAIVGRSLIAMMAFFLLSPFHQHPLLAELRLFPFELLPVLIGFGAISRFLHLLSFYEAIEHLPVSTVSLVSTLNIVGGVTFAHLYLGESVLWYHFTGGALIVLGTLSLELLGVHPTPEHHERHIQQHHRHHL